MLVEFGASILGIGGTRLGEVEGLIVNAGTKRATSVLVEEGHFDRGKHMIGVSSIASSDQNGLHLDETAARSQEESTEIDSEEVSFAQRVEPPTTFLPAAGVGGPVYADPPADPGHFPDSGSFFDIAPIDPPEVEVESNLGANEVILKKGAQVISSDHHTLGDVVAFELGDMGLVEAVTVSEGLIFKERSTFALADIEEFGTNMVHLGLTKEAAGNHRG